MTATCDHHTTEIDLYDIWTADRSTRLYRNEMLRYQHLLRLFPTSNSSRVLDVGCGTGYMSCLLAQKGLSVTAIDISEPSLALFRDRAKQHNIKQMNTDLFDADFTGYDALISQEVLEHIPDFAAAIGKMCSFLRKDGYALFCVPYKENLAAKTKICPKCGEAYHANGHLHHFTIDNLSKAVEDNKFKILTVRRITNKRAVKWLTALHLNANRLTRAFDSLMNVLFPHKATYLAILAVRVD